MRHRRHSRIIPFVFLAVVLVMTLAVTVFADGGEDAGSSSFAYATPATRCW